MRVFCAAVAAMATVIAVGAPAQAQIPDVQDILERAEALHPVPEIGEEPPQGQGSDAEVVDDPAQAQSPGEEIVTGLDFEPFAVRLGDGATARGHVLRFRPDDPRLRLRTVMARDRVPGVEPVASMAARTVLRGALGGVNGGYWLPRPAGAANGFAAQNGGMVGGMAQTASGLPRARGTVGIGAAGAVVLDRLNVAATFVRPDGVRHGISELNRLAWTSGTHARAGEVIAYDRGYGPSVTAPPDSTAVAVDGLRLPRSGTVSGTVREVVQAGSAAREVSIPAGGGLVLAHGTLRPRLSGISPGQTLSVRSTAEPLSSPVAQWAAVRDALPGGPLLVREGATVPYSEWSQEAFSDNHLRGRHPRTAVAMTNTGELLLVTVDGRQSSWSAGMTMFELTAHLRSLGARDAVNLDGGGSTAMTVLDEVRNRPSETQRSVANGLFVYYDQPGGARDIREHACPAGAAPPHGFDDLGGNVHETAVGCLVWYGLTAGHSAQRYAPAVSVSRAQMATFIAGLIDHAAASGSGRSLPGYDGSNRFSDVGDGAVHVDAINRLADAGVVRGGPGGRPATQFGAALPVTREQMATFLAAAHAYAAGSVLPAGANVFADDNRSAHEANINRLAEAGVATGRSPGIFAPQAPVRRDAMASFVTRLLDVEVADGVAAPPD